ncbi:MAG: hypothetical protein ABI947_29605 [Chloroflexota bacterium]
MDNQPALRRRVRQIIDRSSTIQRLKRRAALIVDLVLLLAMLVLQSGAPLILWVIGSLAHLYAVYPSLLRLNTQPRSVRDYTNRRNARRALDRLGVGIAEPDEKAKNDAALDPAIHLLDDGEVAIPWLPDDQELARRVHKLIRYDRPAQRQRLARARLRHLLLLLVHGLLFVGANTLLVYRLESALLLAWAGGLLMHAYTVYAVEPTPEDDEKRLDWILQNIHQVDLIDKPKRATVLHLSDDGELLSIEEQRHQWRDEHSRY